MAAATAAQKHRPLLKIKLGGDGDAERLRAVAEAAGEATLIVDANEAWRPADLRDLLESCASLRVALVEQPLPEGKDELSPKSSARFRSAPTKAHTPPTISRRCVGRYDSVNIKLDKTGGLTGALAMRARARELGFKVMVGCMVAHLAVDGAGRAACPGCRFRRSRRPAAAGARPRARPALRRLARFSAEAGAVGLKDLRN